MKDPIPKFVQAFGDDVEVIAIAEILENGDYTPRYVRQVYAFLCEQFGTIRVLVEIHPASRRGFIANLYRNHIWEHIPFQQSEIRDRVASLLLAKYAELYDERSRLENRLVVLPRAEAKYKTLSSAESDFSA